MPYFRFNNKYRLFYEDVGKGEIILFLHCWAGNHKFWQYQVEEFSKYYRCIAVDLPGHGNSSETGNYGPVAFASVIHQFLSQPQFEGKKFIVAGHSLGGMIGLQLALDHPELVSKLILIDTTAHLRGQLGHDVVAPVVAFFSPLSVSPLRRIAVDLVVVHPTCSLKLRKFIKDEIVKPKNEVVTQTLHGINQFNVKDRLHEIKQDTLIIVGSSDICTDIRHAITLRLGIKNSVLKIVFFASHMSLLERPKQVNEYILEFLKK